MPNFLRTCLFITEYSYQALQKWPSSTPHAASFADCCWTWHILLEHSRLQHIIQWGLHTFTIAHTLLCNPPACHTVRTGALCSIDHAAAAIETQERLVQAFSYAQAIQRRRCRFCLQHLYQLCCVCGKMLLAADQELTHLQLHCCFGDMQELQLILVLHTANVSLVLQAW